jgi:multisubunit Na+/H+ antiporter MnhC subunit
MMASTVRYTEPALRRAKPMSASNEFINVAILTAIVVGVALLSRFF